MSVARAVLLRASKSPWLASQMTQRAFARRAVRKFMPGEALTDALGAATNMQAIGIGSLITRLGETLTGASNAAGVRDHYIGALADIAAQGLRTQISIKPTQLGLDSSVADCVNATLPIVEKAAESGTLIWIDMEDSSYVDRTLELFEQLRARGHANVGLALQAYLYRTPQDLERLLPLKPTIRLVKGAYAEPPNVAFPVKRDTDAQYVSLSETMLQAATSGGALPVFGTHDMNIVHRLISKAGALKLTAQQYEVHMLYGIRSAEQRTLTAAGTTVKCLISYGENWFPWYMRRLAERPANVWFVVKSMLT